MNTSPITANKNLVMLAQTLARLDRSAVPVDAEQYRTLAGRVAAELGAIDCAKRPAPGQTTSRQA